MTTKRTSTKEKALSVKREDLLAKLEMVKPGLASKEIIEQTSCFVFRDGYVITYNDHITCRCAVDIDFEGAVPAKPFLELLRELRDSVLTLSNGDGRLNITGRPGRKSYLTLQNEILLPLDSLEEPDEWRPLPTDFVDALRMVTLCASRENSANLMTCIHITPKWMEASDNCQIIRYKIKIGTEGRLLARRSALQHLTTFDMTEFGESDLWIHFRNPSGLEFACRKYKEEYFDLGPLLQVKGEKVQLPEGLVDAAKAAHIFTRDNADHDLVKIELQGTKQGGGKIRISGQGIHGGHSEIKLVNYRGSNMSFLIDPELLTMLTKYGSCEVENNKLKIDGDRFRYVAVLGKPSS